jgi:PAS domain S-box-containing protein
MTDSLDFRRLFESLPGLYVIVEARPPRYAIVALSDAFARETMTRREDLVGQSALEVLPDDTAASFARVIATRAPERLPVQRRDRPRGSEGDAIEETWCQRANSPVLGPDGDVAFIVHRVEDVAAEVAQERTDTADLRELVDSAPDGIFIADRDGRYTDVNAAGCRLLGYSREELIGRSIRDLVSPDELDRQADLARRLRAGAAEVSMWWLRRKDGTYVPVELSSNALPGGRLRAFVRDATERREAEERMRLSEARLSAIVTIAAEAIISIDEAQHITLFNEGAQKVFGYTQAEIVGRPIHTLLPERYRDNHHREVDRFAANREPTGRRMADRRVEVVGLRKSGEEFPAEASISRTVIGDRRVLTVVLRDVTEQRRVEREQRFLAEAGAAVAATLGLEPTLATIAQLAVRELADLCALNILREDGVLVPVELTLRNPALAWTRGVFQALAGKVPTSPIQTTLEARRAVLVPEVSAEMVDSWVQSAEHRRALDALDVRSLITVPVLADGSLVGTMELISSSRAFGQNDLRLAEALSLRAGFAIRNAQLYARAQRAIQVRDDVMGVVAHDLRNPLSAILMRAQLLEGGGDQARQGEAIAHAAHRMSRLIDDLLDVTRIEAGQLAITTAEIPVAELVAEAIEDQRVLAAAAGLGLQVEVGAGVRTVRGDRDRLLQVLGNLIGNAVKFTPAGGGITVTAAAGGDHVELSVADTGRGISAEDLPRVFDRFWRAQETGRSGAGLGLAIAKGIVEVHGGRMWVTSAPGRGTTFFFSISAFPERAVQCDSLLVARGGRPRDAA